MSNQIIVAIDPGLSGAYCISEQSEDLVFRPIDHGKFPIQKNREYGGRKIVKVDDIYWEKLYDLIFPKINAGQTWIYIEKINSRKYPVLYRNYKQLLSFCNILVSPEKVRPIAPNTWQSKVFGYANDELILKKGDSGLDTKDRSRIVANFLLFGANAPDKVKITNHNIADAICINFLGWINNHTYYQK